jgi:hypothetical protein
MGKLFGTEFRIEYKNAADLCCKCRLNDEESEKEKREECCLGAQAVLVGIMRGIKKSSNDYKISEGALIRCTGGEIRKKKYPPCDYIDTRIRDHLEEEGVIPR